MHLMAKVGRTFVWKTVSDLHLVGVAGSRGAGVVGPVFPPAVGEVAVGDVEHGVVVVTEFAAAVSPCAQDWIAVSIAEPVPEHPLPQ